MNDNYMPEWAYVVALSHVASQFLNLGKEGGYYVYEGDLMETCCTVRGIKVFQILLYHQHEMREEIERKLLFKLNTNWKNQKRYDE